jgi:hypothetical protein
VATSHFPQSGVATGRELAPFDNDGILFNIKKKRVIRNEIMVFHKNPHPITQSPHPYTEMWKKMKLQHKYSKVLFVLLERMLNDNFFKGRFV